MNRRTQRRIALAVALSGFVLGVAAMAVGAHAAKRRTARAPAHAAAPRAPAPSSSASPASALRCAEQRPQPFLVRTNWFTQDEAKAGHPLQQKANRWRTEHYGYFKGFGRPEWNAHAPGHYAVQTTFFGLPITVNQKIVPALHCVEKALRESKHDADYKPRGIGGIRYHNTYRGTEVSNHVYGIALDIDSDVNTCCGCMGVWSHHPLCKKQVQSVYERTKLPPSWVDAFERHGFYWLGHDPMQDTMHFEFLGDPDRILEPAPGPNAPLLAPPASSSAAPKPFAALPSSH